MLWDIGKNGQPSQTSVVRFLARMLFGFGLKPTTINVVLKITKIVKFSKFALLWDKTKKGKKSQKSIYRVSSWENVLTYTHGIYHQYPSTKTSL